MDKQLLLPQNRMDDFYNFSSGYHNGANSENSNVLKSITARRSLTATAIIEPIKILRFTILFSSLQDDPSNPH